MAYAPQSQFYQRGMYTVVRTKAPPQVVAEGCARSGRIGGSRPSRCISPKRWTGGTREVLALPRFTAGLVSAFSTLALVLAGVGIFGVTAYAVGQRTREFGIRMALGAPRSHVCGLVLGRVGRLTAAGVVLGVALALALGRLMSGMLFGVESVGRADAVSGHRHRCGHGAGCQPCAAAPRTAGEPGRDAARRVAGGAAAFTRSGLTTEN